MCFDIQKVFTFPSRRLFRRAIEIILYGCVQFHSHSHKQICTCMPDVQPSITPMNARSNTVHGFIHNASQWSSLASLFCAPHHNVAAASRAPAALNVDLLVTTTSTGYFHSINFVHPTKPILAPHRPVCPPRQRPKFAVSDSPQ